MSAPTSVVPHKAKMATVNQMFADRKKQMERTLAKSISPERLTTLAIAAVHNTPKLLDCDPLSFVSSVIQAGRLGLEPDGLLGQAYLVPFKGKVQLVPGYKGLLKMARNSGQIATIQAHEVHERDRFKFHYGLDPVLEHEPTSEDDPGRIIAFYAVARLKDGSAQFDVMWARQVNEIRDGSQGYQAAKKFGSVSVWDNYYAEMGKKTVLRRLCKMLPASVELQRAISLDEEADAGIDQTFDLDIVPESDEPLTSKLDAVVDAHEAEKANSPVKPDSIEGPPPPSATDKRKGKTSEPQAPAPSQAKGNPEYAETEPDPFGPGGELFKK